MKAINVLLSFAVSLLIFGLVFEGGLRLIGKGPRATIHEFHPELGWVKRPGSSSKHRTSEFDVTFQVNELGLRDDPMASPEKPDGTYRVVMLGDSFVLGYTVDREDLFADLLERRWRAEGRPVDLINAGTEGWSTDQEVLWLLEEGGAFEPDLVLLFPYENDLYWNGREKYDRFPKPRFEPDGSVEERTLVDPGEKPWIDRLALSFLLAPFRSHTEALDRWSPDGEGELVGPMMEWSAYFHDQPDFIDDAVARTRGALIALRRECARIGADLCVIPIPNKASVEDRALARLRSQLPFNASTWSTDKPVDTFLAIAREQDIPAFDPRPALKAAAKAADGSLYYDVDWHLNPAGNRAFADFLSASLDGRAGFPGRTRAIAADAPAATSEETGGEPGFAGVAKVFFTLWALLGSLYAYTYRKEEQPLLAFLKVGGLLVLVFLLIVFGKQAMGPVALGIALVGILGFVVYKLGRRLGTIMELLTAFVLRGHWYLMPLIVVLLTVGSLLVVAASSPLVAPFIYTLF